MIGGTQFIQLSPFVPELEGEDMLDVCATHFDPKRYGEPPIERGFFDIGGADVWSGVRENSLLVFGYPTSLRKIQIDDLGALESLKFSLTVTSARYSHPSSAKGLHAIHLQRKGEHTSDGLSGGTLYQVGEDAQGFYCGFAGLILRGSNSSNNLYFMDPRLISDFFSFKRSS